MKRPLPPPSNEEWEDMEDAAADLANTLSLRACKDLGVQDSFLDEWFNGVVLEGAENAVPFFLDDYPSLKDNAVIAGAVAKDLLVS
jgi:hypothetical protein